MLIDWFTVGAQALNFLLLVWLLKRFLYRPILAAIDAREKKVAAQLADAQAKSEAALKEQEDFKNKNADLDQRRSDLLKKAADEAQTERLRLLEEARKAADALTEKRKESLSHEAQALGQALTA